MEFNFNCEEVLGCDINGHAVLLSGNTSIRSGGVYTGRSTGTKPQHLAEIIEKMGIASSVVSISFSKNSKRRKDFLVQ